MTDDRPVTLITASAQGLGEAIARQLNVAGHRLVLLDRGEGVLKQADKLGGVAIAGSVTEEADIRAAADLALATWGRIDNAVVNTPRSTDILRAALGDISGFVSVNARTLGYDPDFRPELAAIPASAFASCYDLHVLPLVRVAGAITPHLKGRGGAIVAISGMDAAEVRLTFPLGPVRLALHGYAKLYADRYASDGIRMNCIAPGVLENSQSKDAELPRAIPMGRSGKLSEVAQTVEFLLSEAAGYITGQVLTVDGGLNRSV